MILIAPGAPSGVTNAPGPTGVHQEETMFAVVAAVIFGIELLLDFLDVSRTDPFTWPTLIAAGLFFLALHFAGFGTNTHWGSRRGRR
jgi:hypothetical protein